MRTYVDFEKMLPFDPEKDNDFHFSGDEPPNTECTPILLGIFLVFSLIFVLSFHISNGIALYLETGEWRLAEPVMQYSSRSNEWSPSYQGFYILSIVWLTFISWAMLPLKGGGKNRFEHGYLQDDGCFMFTSFGLFWGIFTFWILSKDISAFTSPELQTAVGVAVAQSLFRGITILYNMMMTLLIVLQGIFHFTVIRLPQWDEQQHILLLCSPVALGFILLHLGMFLGMGTIYG